MRNHPITDLRTAEGRQAVEKWVQEMVKPLEGRVEPREYGDYILPLLTLKRVLDVFEDEVKRIASELEKIAGEAAEEWARSLVDDDHELVRFYIPEGRTWEAIGARQEGLGAFMDETVDEIVKLEENEALRGAIDWIDYSALDDGTLKGLVEVLSRYRLGLRDADPMLLEEVGRALRRLAGETLPPDGLNRLLCGLVLPKPGEFFVFLSEEAGELVGECHRYLLDRYGAASQREHLEERDGMRKLPYHLPISRFYGYEPLDAFGYGTANAVFHEIEDQTVLTSTPLGLRIPFYTPVTYDKSDKPWEEVWKHHKNPGAWLRMAVAMNAHAVRSGNEGHAEAYLGEFRRRLVEDDLVEAVVSTPTHLAVLINRAKRHRGETLMIEAPADLTRADADRITGLVERWDGGDGIGVIVEKEEIARNGYDLLPSRYVRTSR